MIFIYFAIRNDVLHHEIGYFTMINPTKNLNLHLFIGFYLTS